MTQSRLVHIFALLGITCLSALAAGCGRAGTSGDGKDPLRAEIRKLHGPARQEALAFARILNLRPSMAHDYSSESGEYCLNSGAHVMTHFSSRPQETNEDIVYFVDAAPLVAHGLRLEEFPALDPELGAMRSNIWYRYEGEGLEPHHGRERPEHTWLMLAVDIL
ncbi:MAG: hypothetical protein V3U86_11835 [Acidobacteriota bacterium]|nr:hypothetical protein [Acidobacteriota bacterium]